MPKESERRYSISGKRLLSAWHISAIKFPWGVAGWEDGGRKEEKVEEEVNVERRHIKFLPAGKLSRSKYGRIENPVARAQPRVILHRERNEDTVHLRRVGAWVTLHCGVPLRNGTPTYPLL